MDQNHKMDTDEFQFLSFPPELSHSSDQIVPGNDAEGFFRTSPLSSPSYQLHLLRLSSDSDDCVENLSPFSSCSMEFSITDESQCQREEEQLKEHPPEAISDSGRTPSQFVFKMEIGNDDATVVTTGQEEHSRRLRINSLNPHSDANPVKNHHRQTGQPNAKHRNSGKDRQPSRKNSHREVKKKNDPGRPTTDQNTDPSDFMIPSTSCLARRRKLRSQPSQHPSQDISPEQNAAISCPAPLTSPRKSPVLTPNKINQSIHASKNPRHAPIQGGHFVFPENSGVPRQSTKTTRVGSEKAYKQNTVTTAHGHCEETFQERNRKATIPSLPKICQSGQRRESRDHVGTPVESCAVAPQSPRRSPRTHAAGLELPSPLCTSEGETSVLDPNTVPSTSVIFPTSNPELRQKLKRGMSSTSAAESRKKSTKRNGISSQEPRLLSRPTLSSNRVRFPLPLKSPQTSPEKSPILATQAPESPRSATARHNYFVPPDVPVPRPPNRRIRLGSSGRFTARQESQRSSSSNGATQGSSLFPAKTPKSTTGKDRYFVYPEIPQEPRPTTTKTRVGTGTMLEQQGEIKPSNKQTVTSKKHGETPKQINSSVPSLPKIPNVQPSKQGSRKKGEKTLLEICNGFSSQKRTV